jgi:hypothetical protein
MKRHLLLAISFLAIVSVSNAQITKGTVLLGGSAGASTYTTKAFSAKEKERGFTVSPSAGFTVKDNHVLGISLTYGHSTKKLSDVQSRNDQFGGSLFYRRYLPLGRNFYFFGNGDARYTFSLSKSAPDVLYTSRQEQKTASLTLYPGIAYAVSKRFHLEVVMNDLLACGYTETQHKWSAPGEPSNYDHYKSLSFQTNTSLSTNLVVGFRILLAKDRAKTQTSTPE